VTVTPCHPGYAYEMGNDVDAINAAIVMSTLLNSDDGPSRSWFDCDVSRVSEQFPTILPLNSVD